MRKKKIIFRMMVDTKRRERAKKDTTMIPPTFLKISSWFFFEREKHQKQQIREKEMKNLLVDIEIIESVGLRFSLLTCEETKRRRNPVP